MVAMFDLVPAGGVRLVLVLVGLYIAYKTWNRILQTYRCRHMFQGIPGLPRHPVWGNIINMGQKLDPSLGRHPDYGFEEVWHALNSPPCFLLDLAPIDGVFLIVADPTIAEQIVQPTNVFKYSLPKSETLLQMYRLIGWESLIIAEGEDWKALRRRFNKGFQPAHLHSLDSLIIDKTRTFVDRLKASAAKDEVFYLKDYAMDLTTDIITLLSIEKDFQAQVTPDGVGHKRPLGMLTASRKLSALVFRIGQGFDPLRQFDPIRPVKSWFYEQIFNRELEKVIRTQIDSTSKELPAAEDTGAAVKDKEESKWNIGDSGKSITRLALAGLRPTPTLIKNTVSQIKSFLFAGQDTTATLIQWCAFELSKASWSPHYAAIRKALCAEHDAVFGHDPANLFNALDALDDKSEAGRKTAESILAGRLPYTTAFIKEALRLHPPAATARRIPPFNPNDPSTQALTITLPVINANGVASATATHDVSIDNIRVYNCQHLIHRNPAVWGADANLFRPERWLDDAYIAALPTGAFRPFERGPRNCIGQELTMLEAKVVLCATARGLAFEKVGFTGKGSHKVDANGQQIIDAKQGDPERELWSINVVTSVPADGMKMKCSLRTADGDA